MYIIAVKTAISKVHAGVLSVCSQDACQRALATLQASVPITPVDNSLRITFTELPEVDLDSGPEDERDDLAMF